MSRSLSRCEDGFSPASDSRIRAFEKVDLPCPAPREPGSIRGMKTWPRFFTWDKVAIFVVIGGVLTLIVEGPLFFRYVMRSLHGDGPQLRAILADLNLALRSYHVEYGRWPLPDPGEGGVVVEGALLAVLLGEEGPMNPRAIQFIDLPAKGEGDRLNGIEIGASGAQRVEDRWSHPILVRFLSHRPSPNGPPSGGLSERVGWPQPIAFSTGPDGIPGNEDDVTSWRG